MRILHVGFGFRPWLVNGLVTYSETVMDGQVRNGHEVGYFFPARQLPGLRRPFLHGWERRGVQMFELVNSSLLVGRNRGTPDPDAELHHAPSEANFAKVLRRFQPELVHVHDLGGLPSSLLDLGRANGLPVVLTIHDYHPLCPTVKLFDADDRICMRSEPGAMCAVCCADSPDDNREELAWTLAYARRQLRSAIPSLDAALRRPGAQRLGAAGVWVMERAAGLRPHDPSTQAPGPQARTRPPRASACAYQRRRDVNLERLNRLDALLASSNRSAEVYRRLGVGRPPIEIVPLNPPHIERLRPRRRELVGEPMRFVALNVCSSTQKGAELLVEALTGLSQRGLDGRYRVSVYGPVAPHVHAALVEHPSVDLHGAYGIDQLDQLLEPADVGLLPSVWEEVYGFVGLELLAKGIPVIGNAIGAIPEYVLPGQTGWLNRSCSATELAELMASAIDNPAEVRRLSDKTVELRTQLIRPFDAGLGAIETVYREVIARRGPG